MKVLGLVGLVLASALPLCAQEYKLSERELGTYKGSQDTVRSVMNYCDALDDSFEAQQPRIFAKLKISTKPEPPSDRWREFANREEWQATGKPAPLAFVWDRDGRIVRVTMVASPPRVGAPSLARQRIDYCYSTDTKLARIRSVWYVPQSCEFLFPCRLISGREFLLGGQRPAVTDWVFVEDGTIIKLRNGKVVDDYFDPANSLTADDLHLKTSVDLPFNHPSSRQ